MTKLLLSGIILLVILTGCSDRNEDFAPVEHNEPPKMLKIVEKRNEAARVVEDTINKPLNLNLINNKQDAAEAEQETIDPTKSDRPK